MNLIPIESLELEQATYRLALSLTHFLWQATVIGCAAVLGDALFRHASSATRYALHSTALLALPTCFLVTMATISVPTHWSRPQQRIEPPLTGEANGVGMESLTDASGAANEVLNQEWMVVPNAMSAADEANAAPDTTRASIASSPVTDASVSRPLLARQATLIAILYALGCGFFLVRLIVAFWGGRRLRRESNASPDASLVRLASTQARKLGLRLTPVIAISQRVAVPTVIGVIRPVVLLPSALITGLSPDQLGAIVGHELAHIRRNDLLLNLIQRVIESILFFHPVVWYISYRMSTERESCCDDLIVSTGHDRLSYADALLRMAELCLGTRSFGSESCGAVSVAATGTSRTQFEHRIKRMLRRETTSQFRLPRTTLLLFLVLILPAVLIGPALVHGTPITQQGSESAGRSDASESLAKEPDATEPDATERPRVESTDEGAISDSKNLPKDQHRYSIEIDGPKGTPLQIEVFIKEPNENVPRVHSQKLIELPFKEVVVAKTVRVDLATVDGFTYEDGGKVAGQYRIDGELQGGGFGGKLKSSNRQSWSFGNLDSTESKTIPDTLPAQATASETPSTSALSTDFQAADFYGVWMRSDDASSTRLYFGDANQFSITAKPANGQSVRGSGSWTLDGSDHILAIYNYHPNPPSFQTTLKLKIVNRSRLEFQGIFYVRANPLSNGQTNVGLPRSSPAKRQVIFGEKSADAFQTMLTERSEKVRQLQNAVRQLTEAAKQRATEDKESTLLRSFESQLELATRQLDLTQLEYSRQIQLLESELGRAKLNLTIKHRAIERNKQLFAAGALSQLEIDQAELELRDAEISLQRAESQLEVYTQAGKGSDDEKPRPAKDQSSKNLAYQSVWLAYESAHSLIDLDNDETIGPMARGVPADAPEFDLYTSVAGPGNAPVLMGQLRKFKGYHDHEFEQLDDKQIIAQLASMEELLTTSKQVIARSDDKRRKNFIAETSDGSIVAIQVTYNDRIQTEFSGIKKGFDVSYGVIARRVIR